MSFISSSASTRIIELAPSGWPAWLWLIALATGALAIFCTGLSPGWQLVALMTAGWVASLEWRARCQPVSLLLTEEWMVCALKDGQILQVQRPFTGMNCPGWISVAMPGRYWRRRWLTIYRDQLGADDFRRLRIMMRF